MNRRIVNGIFLTAAVAVLLAACNASDESTDTRAAGSSEPAAAAVAGASRFLPADRGGRVALGLEHDSARELYQALMTDAGGGQPLEPDNLPDWTGLWTRVGNPFYDPEQDFSELTTARLRPNVLDELRERRELSAQGIEYDPISDCSPPGFPRWLAIPFLREFIVTPTQLWLTSETVNNIRRVYTDGRDHVPEADRYPLWYGDSIGFWTDHTLVIHTNQLRENVFHRNDPRHSDQLETVEAWQKVDADTIVADVWAYDPLVLLEPWYVRQTFKLVPNPDKNLRIRYWHCNENPNNVVIQTDAGTSEFGDFTFTDAED